MLDESTQFREPSLSELQLLALLAKQAPSLEASWLDGIRVVEMTDGGMGSLRLITRKQGDAVRLYGMTVAEYQFEDADGVKVIATLNVDREGEPYELDIWKTDFSPLIRFPCLAADPRY